MAALFSKGLAADTSGTARYVVGWRRGEKGGGDVSRPFGKRYRTQGKADEDRDEVWLLLCQVLSGQLGSLERVLLGQVSGGCVA